MIAAKEGSVFFEPMPNDATFAMTASRCQGMNGAFEAIENVLLAGHNDFKRLVIVVSAVFTCRHVGLLIGMRVTKSFKNKITEN